MLFLFFFLCFRASLFIDVMWSPAGKGLTSWLSFVVSNCEVVMSFSLHPEIGDERDKLLASVLILLQCVNIYVCHEVEIKNV